MKDFYKNLRKNLKLYKKLCARVRARSDRAGSAGAPRAGQADAVGGGATGCYCAPCWAGLAGVATGIQLIFTKSV